MGGHHAGEVNESDQTRNGGQDEPDQDELTQIRALLRPPPTPGVQDWGIPPETTEPCDPALSVRPRSYIILMHPNKSGKTHRIHNNETRKKPALQ